VHVNAIFELMRDVAHSRLGKETGRWSQIVRLEPEQAGIQVVTRHE
jgi:hypothetical protein